jgi:hypothetical protein
MVRQGYARRVRAVVNSASRFTGQRRLAHADALAAWILRGLMKSGIPDARAIVTLYPSQYNVFHMRR